MDVQKRSTLSVVTMEWVFPIIVLWREQLLLLVKASPSRNYIMAHAQVRMTISSHLFNFLFSIRRCLYFSSLVPGPFFFFEKLTIHLAGFLSLWFYSTQNHHRIQLGFLFPSNFMDWQISTIYWLYCYICTLFSIFRNMIFRLFLLLIFSKYFLVTQFFWIWLPLQLALFMWIFRFIL